MRVGVVLLPIVLWLLARPLAPRLSEPMVVTPPPSPPGIPLADLLLAAAVGWALLGGVIVARSRKLWVVALGLFVFTIPAFFAVILGPAIILILQDLA